MSFTVKSTAKTLGLYLWGDPAPNTHIHTHTHPEYYWGNSYIDGKDTALSLKRENHTLDSPSLWTLFRITGQRPDSAWGRRYLEREHPSGASGKPPLPINLCQGLLRPTEAWHCLLLSQHRLPEAKSLLSSTEQHGLGLFLSLAQNL